MSVPTEADKHLDAARENVANAVSALAKIVVDRVDGWDSFNERFSGVLKEAFTDLIETREKLQG